MYQYPKISLQVFAKSPLINTVKTRLQPKFTPEFSRDLHCALVDYCLTTWETAKVCPIDLWLAGDKMVFTSHLQQWQSLSINEQQGKGLGERLLFASQTGLAKKNNQAVILVGTDCPFIDTHYLQAACAALFNNDVVVGGADDGGYVLLGLKQPKPELFTGIDWGSERVYEQTLSAIAKENLSYSALPRLADIDRPSDIQRLKSMSAFDRFTYALA